MSFFCALKFSDQLQTEMSSATTQTLGLLGLTQTGATVQKGGRTFKQTLPHTQQAPPQRFPQFTSITCPAVPSNLFSNQGANWQFSIDNACTDVIHKGILEIKLQVSGAPVVLAPVPHWFNRIELRTVNGTVLKSWYGDTLFSTISAGLSDTRAVTTFRSMNVDTRPGHHLGLAPELPVGIHDFYLPLEGSLWDDLAFYWKAAKQDLVVYMTPEPTIIASGAGTVSVLSMNFRVIGDRLGEDIKKHYELAARSLAQSALFLEPTPVFFTNKQFRTDRTSYRSIRCLVRCRSCRCSFAQLA